MSSSSHSEPSQFNSTETDPDGGYHISASPAFNKYSAYTYQSIDAFSSTPLVNPTKRQSVDSAELSRRKFRVAVVLTSLTFVCIVLCLAFFVPRNVDVDIIGFETTVKNLPGNNLAGSVSIQTITLLIDHHRFTSPSSRPFYDGNARIDVFFGYGDCNTYAPPS
eukprot:TRINITY_DN170_c0_g1_i1.p1 TRINITY_DN170_c0_g1~~TRINITY_DN170_c0_g1_i1.p1  ORF type:complete len:164 (+),score=29.82 TRINITY_DN170_c0_g1_i1:54-545(+)